MNVLGGIDHSMYWYELPKVQVYGGLGLKIVEEFSMPSSTTKLRTLNEEDMVDWRGNAVRVMFVEAFAAMAGDPDGPTSARGSSRELLIRGTIVPQSIPQFYKALLVTLSAEMMNEEKGRE